jgi:hypothetical protein
MKFQKSQLFLVIIIMLIFSTACNSSSMSLLGQEVFRAEGGGYEYRVPIGYENQQQTPEAVVLLAPEADGLNGPLITLNSTISDTEMTNEELLASVGQYFATYVLSESKKIKIDGIEGLEVSFTAGTDTEEIEGRIIVAMVTPTHAFFMLGGGPKDLWQAENKAFEQVINSVKFFEPNLAAE